jgi:hypothetical protein
MLRAVGDFPFRLLIAFRTESVADPGQGMLS